MLFVIEITKSDKRISQAGSRPHKTRVSWTRSFYC